MLSQVVLYLQVVFYYKWCSLSQVLFTLSNVHSLNSLSLKSHLQIYFILVNFDIWPNATYDALAKDPYKWVGSCLTELYLVFVIELLNIKYQNIL